MENRLNILLIGKGAREHSLAWKLGQSPIVQHVYVVPGNGGTVTLPNVSNISHVEEHDYLEMVHLSIELNIGLVVPGPDHVVVDGVGDYFRNAEISCFAPSRAAAEIEGSKALAKEFMIRHNIPTATHQHLETYSEAKRFLDHLDACDRPSPVIKVDGLAAGKGVFLPSTLEEAQKIVSEIMIDNKFGTAGGTVVMEEYLEGDEISILTFVDGKTFKSLPPGQDHKSIHEGNKGPNTGGMGVFAPVPFLSNEQMVEIEQKIIKPTLDGLQSEGRPFMGMLFTGVMMTADGPKVLEYNVRFGDPETQSMMMLLAPDFDLAAVLMACCQQTLSNMQLPMLPGYACNVVVAAGGYPGLFAKGDLIELGPCPQGTKIFHAGTKRNDENQLVTCGGRVISAAAYGETLEEAVTLAYEAARTIRFRGMVMRSDIASSALSLDKNRVQD